MIRAEFFYKKGEPQKFVISGHAGYAESGKDIVCASVSSAVQMAINGITEVVRIHCDIHVDEETNAIECILPPSPRPAAWHFVSALRLQLGNLSEDFPGTINLIITEV